MHHRIDLSDCHQPFGNSASASNMFWLCMIPTFHGICILDASHFEHAVKRWRRRRKKKNSFSKTFNKSKIQSDIITTTKLLKIDTIQRQKRGGKMRGMGLFLYVYSCRVQKNQYTFYFQQHEMSSFRWNYIIFHVHNKWTRKIKNVS